MKNLIDNFSENADSSTTEGKLEHTGKMVYYTFLNGAFESIDTEELKKYESEILDYIGE